MKIKLRLLVMLSGYCLSGFAQAGSETRVASRFNDFQGAYVDNYVHSGATNVAYDDNSYAYTKKLTSNQSYASLLLQGFNFTIPSNAVIENITVSVRRFKTGKASIKDYFATLVKSPARAGLMDQYGVRWTHADNYPAMETEVTYTQSGSGNNGGLQQNQPYQWTPAIINDQAFGVRIDVAPPVGSGAVVVYYDKVHITVHFTMPQVTTSSKLVRSTEVELLNEPTVFPNPFKTKTIIQFTASESGKAFVDLYNISGAKVRNLFSGDVSAGQVYKVSAGDVKLTKGIYIYRLTNGKLNQTGKIIKN